MKTKNLKKLKEIERNRKSSLVFTLILISILVILAIIFITIPFNSDYEIPAEEFCISQCGDLSYYSSNNNTNFSFIRCSCVIGVQFSHGEKLGSSDKPKLEISYFDSNSLLEISEGEIKLRIENENKR